jgi:3-oxoacyl-[acyl-carrier-protein] synthase-3
MMHKAGILGVGKAVPKRVVTNADLEEMVDTSSTWIIDRTGIQERRIAANDEATSDIATRAARIALVKAGVNPIDIDLIIVATVTPDMVFPATACLVQANLGATKAAAFDLSAGCSGFIYALDMAARVVQSGAYQRVLVVGADLLSRVTDWTDRSTCVLFGDGAGACVVGRVNSGGILATYLGADGNGGNKLMLPAGGSRNPTSEVTFQKKMHYIHMAGNEVFRFAVKIMGEAAQEVLARANLQPSDIDLFIPHQANIRIIDAAARRLALPSDKVFINVHKYGNTSAASIPIAIAEAVDEGRIQPGKRVVLVGFGAGLTWGAIALEWSADEGKIA